MLDLIIKGGTVVTPDGVGVMDVGIQGEQIAAVAAPGVLDDVGPVETIDATGMIVLPGGIEPHTHINVPVPDYWAGGDDGVFTQPPEGSQPRRRVRRGHHLRGLRRRAALDARSRAAVRAHHGAD